MIRKMLDRIEPLFHKGGKLEKLYPLYEANDTFLFSPGEVTKGSTHVRDPLDLKRMMSMVIVALLPCILMCLYNTGYQAQKIYAADSSLIPADSGGILATMWNGGWRLGVLDALGITWQDSPGAFLSFGSMLGCMIHGLLYFLPIYITTMAVGGLCEVVFSIIRKHEINEGFLVTGMLYPLTLPPDMPLWQVAIGIAFGVVVGKEIFGGTGKNFLNPALTGRAFLYFNFAPEISGDRVWTSVDGFSGATSLGQIAAAKAGSVTEVIAGLPGVAAGTNWWDCFIGNTHGSFGETSTLCCLIGAAILIATRIGSWQIMAGVVLGVVALSSFLWVLPFEQPVYNISPWWHFVIGGLAFGTVYMATDPVSAAMTEQGKWAYGFLIGVITVVVRTINPAFPEGIMLAILFGNLFAPLIDWFVIQANVKRRVARHAA